uniref:Zonadhesin n=1 Tax=Magallana gigas TaxID=29159 RepID=K1QA24_MAGGI
MSRDCIYPPKESKPKNHLDVNERERKNNEMRKSMAGPAYGVPVYPMNAARTGSRLGATREPQHYDDSNSFSDGHFGRDTYLGKSSKRDIEETILYNANSNDFDEVGSQHVWPGENVGDHRDWMDKILGGTFQRNYLDRNSFRMRTVIERSFVGDEFRQCNVKELLNGSVIVIFQITFIASEKQITKDNLIIWINTEIRNGVNSTEGTTIAFISNSLDVSEIKRESYTVNNDPYGATTTSSTLSTTPSQTTASSMNMTTESSISQSTTESQSTDITSSIETISSETTTEMFDSSESTLDPSSGSTETSFSSKMASSTLNIFSTTEKSEPMTTQGNEITSSIANTVPTTEMTTQTTQTTTQTTEMTTQTTQMTTPTTEMTTQTTQTTTPKTEKTTQTTEIIQTTNMTTQTTDMTKSATEITTPTTWITTNDIRNTRDYNSNRGRYIFNYDSNSKYVNSNNRNEISNRRNVNFYKTDDIFNSNSGNRSDKSNNRNDNPYNRGDFRDDKSHNENNFPGSDDNSTNRFEYSNIRVDNSNTKYNN